jgi:hypothetical protein
MIWLPKKHLDIHLKEIGKHLSSVYGSLSPDLDYSDLGKTFSGPDFSPYLNGLLSFSITESINANMDFHKKEIIQELIKR